MTTLLIDAGNTRLKWSYIGSQGERMVSQYVDYARGQLDTCLLYLLKDLPVVQRIILVHVLGKEVEQPLEVLADQQGISLHFIRSQQQAYGVQVAYPDPSRLGADRFVAMVAAKRLFPTQACIVVDAGTAVTIDALDSTGKHYGGLILTGLRLSGESLIARSKAAHMNQLVLDDIQLFASDTLQAIGSGSVFGLAGSIDGICSKMSRQFEQPVNLILTGGDAAFLQPYLINNYNLQPDLVMQGLQYMAEC